MHARPAVWAAGTQESNVLPDRIDDMLYTQSKALSLIRDKSGKSDRLHLIWPRRNRLITEEVYLDRHISDCQHASGTVDLLLNPAASVRYTSKYVLWFANLEHQLAAFCRKIQA